MHTETTLNHMLFPQKSNMIGSLTLPLDLNSLTREI